MPEQAKTKCLIGRCRQWNQGWLSDVYVQHLDNFVSLIVLHLLCMKFSQRSCYTYSIIIYGCIRSLDSFFECQACNSLNVKLEYWMSSMHTRSLDSRLVLYSSNLIKLWDLYLASDPLHFILNIIPFENKFSFIKFVLSLS